MAAPTTDSKLDRAYRRIAGLGLEDLPFLVTLVFLLLFLVLVGALVFGATFFAYGDGAGITLDKVIEVYSDPGTYQLLGNTLFVGVASGFLGTLIAAVYTWLVVRTDVPGRRYFRLLAILSAAMPGIIMTLGWISALAPGHGFINKVSRALVGFDLFNIYTPWGIVLAISLGVLQSAFLLLETPFQNVSSELEEASRVAGYSRLETLRKVTLPMLFPALFSSFLLSTIYGIGNFEFVLFFTTYQGGMETFATEIYSVIKLNMIPAYGEAAILSIPYMLVAMALIALYHYYTQKREKYVTVAGAGSRSDRIELGPARYLGSLYCLLIWCGAFAIPALGIAGMALSPQLGSAFEAITFENFAAFFALADIQSVIVNTITFAFLGAVGVVIVATLISYTSVKYDHRLARIGDYASTIPLGLPPMVYGLSIFWMILLVPGFNTLHGTIVPLVIAIIFMKTPHGVRIISSNLIQISDEYEEASRVSGWSWAQSFRKITLPLSVDGIGNAFLFVFIDSMKELAGIVLLITAGSDVFTNYIMQLYGNDPSGLPTIAAGAVVFTGFIFVFVLVQTKLQGMSASRQFLY